MDIDRLDIIISAEASKAEKQLNKLVSALGKLSSVLGGLNTSGLTGLANSVQRLSVAMQGMNAVKTTDFTRLAKNIQKLAGIDTQSLNAAASSMEIIGKALSGLGSASANAQAIGDVAKNLSKLGHKGIQNAIANMPQLASALKNMMQTLQSAPRVSSNLIRMTEAMGKLASNGNRVGSAARSLNSGFKSYGNNADASTRKTKSLASAIGMLYAKFWVLQRAIKGLFGAIEKSMNFSETVNYFEVAMRKIGDDASRKWQEYGYDSAESYSKSFSKRLKELTSKMTGFEIDSDGNALLTNQKNLGLDPDKVMQYQAQYAQMADSIGMTEEAALNTSKALTMLGTDWASLRNISFDQAWEKFASALAGQSRAVRALGIDITQATLQEYAYKYGIEAKVSEMNQATKAQLRLLAIIDQSKVAFGDLANTIQSPANQLRMLQQNFSNLARIIGNLFLPVIAKVLPYINGMVIALQRLFQWIGNLLGVKFSNINTSIGGMSDSIADIGEEDGIDNISNSANDASDAIGKANESAKKLKKTILGFDELNVLNDNSNDYSSNTGKTQSSSNIPSIGGSPLLDSAIADALAEYEKAWNDAFSKMENKASEFADKISDSFKKIWDTAEPTREALKKLWDEGLSKLGNFTWTSLKDFYSEFFVPVGHWALGKGIPDLVKATNDSLNKIDWSKINTSLKEFWKALAPFATNIGEGLIEFYKDLTSVGADFINKVVPGGLDALASALKKINPETAQKIGYGLGILFTSLTAFKGITWIGNILGSGSPLAKGLSLLSQHPYAALAVGIGGVVVALDKFGIIDVDWDWLWSRIDRIKNVLSEFIGNVDIAGLSTTIGNLWDAFQPFAKGFADGFINAFDVILNDIGAPLINAFAGALGTLAEVLSNIPTEVWEAVGKALGVIVAVKLTKDFVWNTMKLGTALKHIKDVTSGGELSRSISSLSSSLGGLIKNLTGNGGLDSAASTASSGGIKKLSTSILGEAGAYVAVVALTSELAKLVEKLMGGNGILSEMGGALNDLTGKLQNTSQITSAQADEIRNLIEECENAGMTSKEMANTIMQKFAEMGLSTEQLRAVLESAGYQMTHTKDSADMLTAASEQLGEGFSKTADQIDLSSVTANDAWRAIESALYDLSVSGSDFDGTYRGILNTLDRTRESSDSAQIAFDAIVTALEEAGVPTDKFIKLIGEKFPEATKAVKTSVDTNIVGSQETISSSMGTAKTDAVSSLEEIQKTAENTSSAVNRTVDENFGGVATTSGDDWKNSYDAVSGSLSSMERDTKETMQNVMTTVQLRWGSVLINTNQVWEKASEKVKKELGYMSSSSDETTESIVGSFYDLGMRISNAIGDLSWVGRNAAQSLVDGFKSVHIPTPHLYTSSWNTHYLNAEHTQWYQTPNYSVSWYSNGGFPNVGEMFIANENGPEMIGKMSHKNVVANNNQITDGIKAAVVEGMTEVMMATSSVRNEDKPYIMNVTVKTEDDEVLARAVERGRLKQDIRFNPSPAY